MKIKPILTTLALLTLIFVAGCSNDSEEIIKQKDKEITELNSKIWNLEFERDYGMNHIRVNGRRECEDYRNMTYREYKDNTYCCKDNVCMDLGEVIFDTSSLTLNPYDFLSEYPNATIYLEPVYNDLKIRIKGYDSYDCRVLEYESDNDEVVIECL